jgi:hypothetical protein
MRARLLQTRIVWTGQASLVIGNHLTIIAPRQTQRTRTHAQMFVYLAQYLGTLTRQGID